MTDDKAAAELAAIRERVQAATPGPWWFDEDDLMWRLHGVHAVLPPFAEGFPEQVINHQILKAPKSGTPYAEYWPSEADAAFIVEARTDVPRLLAAVEAALSYHQRVPLYGGAATEDEPGNCPHDPDDERWHFEPADEPGEWLCQGRPEGAVCSTCTDGEGGERADWPCDEYAALLGALTGRSTADVLATLTGKEADGAAQSAG